MHVEVEEIIFIETLSEPNIVSKGSGKTRKMFVADSRRTIIWIKRSKLSPRLHVIYIISRCLNRSYQNISMRRKTKIGQFLESWNSHDQIPNCPWMRSTTSKVTYTRRYGVTVRNAMFMPMLKRKWRNFCLI